ncbi:MAG: hypothetical protein AAGN64_06910, partial [Bacteroidota bacterium]
MLPPLAEIAARGLFLVVGFALMVVASGAEKALLPMNDRHRSLLDEVGGARAKRLLWLLDRRLQVRLTLRFAYLLPL